MKFTLSWLKDHLTTDATLDEILDKLTIIGLEVEEVVDPTETLKPFVVGKVVSAEKHPNADKLKVCEVDTGGTTNFKVVCGAPNARKGMLGVFAPPGSYIPGIDLTLTKAEIRGVESSGMLCSERELQLSDEHEGIIELPRSAKVGASFAETMGLNDPVIEIAITPNRPDCLGVRGIARDLAAAGLGKLRKDPVKTVDGDFDCPIPIELRFSEETGDACPAFAGRLIRGVKNKKSPAWMERRLLAIGLRPINALVDVTNYVSYDRGRPLHVYDADKLKGTIHARLAQAGEKFMALDGKEYEPETEMTVIADDSGVLGFGGVIGGEDTGCTLETTNVFIESAYFDPIRTATTGRKAGIISDARFRFERGIDPASLEHGIDQATQLILKTCKGEPSRTKLVGTPPILNRAIEFNISEIARLTGLELKPREIKSILTRLGFEVTGSSESINVGVPSWRPDISQSADLVEEVVRLVGVDAVPTVAMDRLDGVARPVLTENQKRVRDCRRLLAGRGMVEAITWSFIPRPLAENFAADAQLVDVANPISSEMSTMRPSLIPGLLSAAQKNHDRGFTDAALFEIGQAYRGDRPEDQYISVSGIRMGTAHPMGAGRHWLSDADEVDVFDAKADAAAVIMAMGQNPESAQITRDAPDYFHPGKSGLFRLGPKIVLAQFGEIHPQILSTMGIEAKITGFELFIENFPKRSRKSKTKSALNASDFQVVHRDFAFILEKDVPAGKLLKAARGADKKLISDVRLFDLFEDESLGQNKKSLAIEVTLSPQDRTLTDSDIEEASQQIIGAVHKATGGEIRG